MASVDGRLGYCDNTCQPSFPLLLYLLQHQRTLETTKQLKKQQLGGC